MENSKYQFYTTGNKVIAVSTYAGKTVRGVAKCNPKDTFDMEKGKTLAAKRCEVKIAEKRMKRAFNKVDEAIKQYSIAGVYLHDMRAYEDDSVNKYNNSMFELTQMENEL